MPAGPAMLSLMTGAPIMVVDLWHTDSGLQGRVQPPLPQPDGRDRRAGIATLTQSMADAFAGAIREHPEDWHMMQRLWLSDLSPHRDAATGVAR